MQITHVEATGDDRVTITYADGSTSDMAAHVWNIRCRMIKQGLEWEIRFPGGKLTRRAPSCFSIIRDEFGIRGRDKVKRYKEFCALLGMEPSRAIVGDDA